MSVQAKKFDLCCLSKTAEVKKTEPKVLYHPSQDVLLCHKDIHGQRTGREGRALWPASQAPSLTAPGYKFSLIQFNKKILYCLALCFFIHKINENHIYINIDQSTRKKVETSRECK